MTALEIEFFTEFGLFSFLEKQRETSGTDGEIVLLKWYLDGMITIYAKRCHGRKGWYHGGRIGIL